MRPSTPSFLVRSSMGVALAGLFLLAGPRVQAQTSQTCEEVGGTCRPITQAGLCESGERIDHSGTCSSNDKCCASTSCEDRAGACQPGVSACSVGTSALGNATCSSGKCCTVPTDGPTCGELLGHAGGQCSPYSDSCPAGYTNRGPTKDGCLSCCDPVGAGPGPTPSPGGSEYKVEFLHTDALGSVRMVTDQAGAVVSRADYYPFGAQIGTNVNGRGDASIPGYAKDPSLRQRFTGKERDGESQLDYFGARYYSGAQGRFTTPDAPFADQHLGDPQSWNLFSYARNNPLKFVDATGRKVRVADAIALEHVRSTLPKNDRQFLRLGENGFVDGGALAKASKHANVTDLIDLVNSDSLVSVRTAAKVNLKGFGELEFSYETAEEAVATLKKHGIDADPNTVTQNAFSGYTFGDDPKNVEVVLPDNTGTAAKAPISHRATYAAHELFGHAARRVKGQPWLHDDGGPVDQDIIKIEDRTKALYDESRKIK